MNERIILLSLKSKTFQPTNDFNKIVGINLNNTASSDNNLKRSTERAPISKRRKKEIKLLDHCVDIARSATNKRHKTGISISGSPIHREVEAQFGAGDCERDVGIDFSRRSPTGRRYYGFWYWSDCKSQTSFVHSVSP